MASYVEFLDPNQLVTEISIVILLLGTLIGQTAQMGEVGTIGLDAISPNLPNWLVGSSGRVFMVLGTVLIAAPLCLGKQLRQVRCCPAYLQCTSSILRSGPNKLVIFSIQLIPR